MTAQEAYTLAKRKSRFGHRDWIVWKDRNGEFHAELATADSFKAAMLAVGTKGAFSVEGSDGCSYYMTWRLAVSWRRNLQYVA
jgi:hypothetical protein